MKYKICWNEALYLKKIHVPVWWDAEKFPHIAVSGGTGSGKTVLLKIIMLQIIDKSSDATIFILDFKGDDDFSFLSEENNYYRYEAVKEGFDKFYDEVFSRRQRGESSDRTPAFLFFDEWASFTNFLDKKQADTYKQKLSTLLMLGRSFNIHLVISQQRLDADSFLKSRDNFSLVFVLGNPSKEVVGMLFNEFKDKITNDRERGTGYLLMNGNRFFKIIVPFVKDIDNLNAFILSGIGELSN